ncbi:hypothetical protein Bhyg_06415 [Pseudolycoriella hygida]|uniref:Uncharacterized protein n=1 Tax=Pseudolycoriella hygida TaxID=35572 RepID=A0A9Q0N1C5_9DIPT|nr:hypothetical protein Bhyg_06415 [Pseudolycoriella hygida]
MVASILCSFCCSPTTQQMQL